MKVAAITAFLFFLNFFCYGQENKINVLNEINRSHCENRVNDSTYLYITNAIDSVIKSKTEIDNDYFISLISKTGEAYREKGRITNVIELYIKALSCLDNESDSKQSALPMLKLYIPLGASYEEIGMRNRAMEFYLKALAIADENNIDNYKAIIYNNIGAVYYNNNELDKAEEYVHNALEINKTGNNQFELFHNYNNLAGVYFRRNNHDKALDYALLAIQLLDSDKKPYPYYFMQANIGSLYLHKKEYTMALSYIRNAMTHQKKFGFELDLIQTYQYMASYFSEINRSDSTLFYLNKSLELAIGIDNRMAEASIIKKLSKYYSDSREYKTAYEYMTRYTALNDSLNSSDNRRKIEDIEKIYDNDKHIRENELTIKNIALEKANADRRILYIAVFVCFLCLIIVFLIARNRNKEKERKNNELLSLQQASLFEREKDMQLQKETELSSLLDKRNRELTSYTLNMVKTNEFISDISEELKQLILQMNPRDKQTRSHLQQILAKLSHNSTNSNWDEFRYYFEQVHPSFYENLEHNFPDLTVKEKRLCAFLRLGLSTKDISSITFKEVRSVESARNRLRKKLGIESEENLSEFLFSKV